MTRARTPALLATLVACATALVPVTAAHAAPPSLESAAAGILVDARDGAVLFGKHPDAERPIASATKLMTALLTLERAKPSAVFVAANYKPLAVESKINLRRGERMQVADLFEGLMLESANDAAVTLAEGISGSRGAFVAEMNDRAADLGLSHTSYANPIGLDAPDNYSSARDLATLARRLLRDKRFAAVVDMPTAVLESGSRQRVVANRNALVGRFPFVDGVKTGHTGTAGYVLVGAAHGDLGQRVVSVVLGEPSEAARDADTLALLRWGISRYRRAQPLRADRAVASAAISYRDERARLVPQRPVAVLARQGQRITTRVEAPDELDGELAAGTEVGRVEVLRDGKVIDRVRLVTAGRVPGAGLLRKITSTLGTGFTLVAILLLVCALAILGRRASGRGPDDRDDDPDQERLRRARERERARQGHEAAGAP